MVFLIILVREYRVIMDIFLVVDYIYFYFNLGFRVIIICLV